MAIGPGRVVAMLLATPPQFGRSSFLADLGADTRDERVQRGCEYLLDHNVATNDGFSMNRRPVPSGVVHCLNGDALHALLRLGYKNDPRVRSALDWQVQAITGEGEVRFFRSGTSDKGFACAYNLKQPCAWGATKAMKALGAVLPDQRSPAMVRAIELGSNFLLGRDLTKADYPFTERINSSWFAFGFPLSYRSDILETMAVLASLGYGDDTRLGNARQFILDKRDDQGRWTMEKTLNGKMWVDIEKKGGLASGLPCKLYARWDSEISIDLVSMFVFDWLPILWPAQSSEPVLVAGR